MGSVAIMSFMPRKNQSNSVLGNIRRLASFARENLYPQQLRGVSVLGNGLNRLDRMSGYRNPRAESTSARNSFGRFSSPNEGNVAQSGNVADAGRITSTASAGRMTSPSARDSDTIKKWRRE